MTFTRRIKRVLTPLLARQLRREPLTPAGLLALRPRRVLIVRQHNQMGDMVCATPALRAIARTWPEAEIALVTAPANAGVVRHNPHVARLLVFEKPLRRWPRFTRELRAWRPDLTFVLSSVSFSLTSALIGLLSGARYVVGADSRPYGWDFSRHCFSLELPAEPVLTTHAIEHGLAPLRAVGLRVDDATPEVVPSSAERQQAAAIAAGLGLNRGWWALHPGAGKRQNAWPAERFAALAARAAADGHDVLVLHGPADAAALAAFAGAAPAGPGRVRLAPACGVGVAAALLEGADRFLCNDTGIMHVAGALRVPTLALFGPTDPGLWKPPAAEVVALRATGRLEDARGPEFGWIETLTETTVWAAWCGLAGRADTGRDG